MSTFDTSNISWRDPWHLISPEYAANAESEIQREMCAGHILYRRELKALAYRQDCDDILFRVSDNMPHYAVVHLSYQQETRPEWPSTTTYMTLADWVEQRLIPDAEDFAT